MIVFEDRVVQYPNRVKLSPVAGQANTYEVERSEGIILNPGTPLTAENIMKLQQYSNTAGLALEAEKASGYTKGGAIYREFGKVYSKFSDYLPLTGGTLAGNLNAQKLYEKGRRVRVDTGVCSGYSWGSQSTIIYSSGTTNQNRLPISQLLPEGRTVDDIIGMGGRLTIDGRAIYFSTLWNQYNAKSARCVAMTTYYSVTSNNDEHRYFDIYDIEIGIDSSGAIYMPNSPTGMRVGLYSKNITALQPKKVSVYYVVIYF